MYVKTMIEKQWKWIDGYDELYKISNYGEIKSFKRYKDGKLMKPKVDKDGYLEIGIRDSDSKRKFYRVHRLVAYAFIPNPNNYLYINHKDCNPSNNNVENLEWCTVEYNNQYRFEMGYVAKSGEQSSNSKLTTEQVLEIYKLSWGDSYTQKEIADMYNVKRQTITNIKNGSCWTSITNHNKCKNVQKTKLSQEQVLEIYNLAWHSDMMGKEIAQMYNVSDSSVDGIKHGRTWNSVTGHNNIQNIKECFYVK